MIFEQAIVVIFDFSILECGYNFEMEFFFLFEAQIKVFLYYLVIDRLITSVLSNILFYLLHTKIYRNTGKLDQYFILSFFDGESIFINKPKQYCVENALK